ncbi:FAD-dependent oxidoreductase [Streptomyces sp. NPDC006208]|uniref:FAD-dependent oxidoreductase n=1 Tax=Streptomyces sp. NPDC006208 TaxID=3156734 RepID=UPI0033BF21EB
MANSGKPAGSLWTEYDPGPEHPPLRGNIRVDVAVVGAGMAGICTAWELVRAGRQVALVEADRIAHGVTGHTTAKLSALHGMAYHRIRKARGAEGARQYAASQKDAVTHALQVSEALGIDCDLERTAAYTYVTDPARTGDLREEADAAVTAGLMVSYVQDVPLPFPVAGAVRLGDQVQFHPRKFLLALATDLTRRGGRIYECSRVTGLRESDRCRLTTDGGHTVEADDVVVATHYPVFDRALLFTRLEPKREVVIAGPLPPDGPVPDGMFLTEDDNTRSLRTAPAGDRGRLLIVTGEKFTPGDPGDHGAAAHFGSLTRWTTKHFPDFSVTHRWATQDNFSTDHVPYVGRLHARAEHAYVATGFGGWGLSGGVMSGKLLAGLITGTAPAWSSLYDPVRLHPLSEGPEMLRLGAKTAKHFVADRLPGRYTDSVDDIGPGEGAVVRGRGTGPQAVHRDTSGALHRVSARCTHLGCVVHFDEAESAWECPCHGSRFDVDGRVLHGPAVRSLEACDTDDDA